MTARWFYPLVAVAALAAGTALWIATRPVVVILPPPESRLLTRELFYTALTRAKKRVVVVGSPADVEAAIERRAVRATGLRQRLRGPSAP